MVNSLSQKCFISYDRKTQQFSLDASRKGYVYIIRAVGTNRVKIGYSKDPERRLAELRSPQMPFDLELVDKMPFIDAYALEQHIHKMYADFRVRGEWFELPREWQNFSLLTRGEESFYKNVVKSLLKPFVEDVADFIYRDFEPPCEVKGVPIPLFTQLLNLLTNDLKGSLGLLYDLPIKDENRVFNDLIYAINCMGETFTEWLGDEQEEYSLSNDQAFVLAITRASEKLYSSALILSFINEDEVTYNPLSPVNSPLLTPSTPPIATTAQPID